MRRAADPGPSFIASGSALLLTLPALGDRDVGEMTIAKVRRVAVVECFNFQHYGRMDVPQENED